MLPSTALSFFLSLSSLFMLFVTLGPVFYNTKISPLNFNPFRSPPVGSTRVVNILTSKQVEERVLVPLHKH